MAIIFIDPGHGGKDPGGGTNKYFKEKDMVLEISREQKKHFERNNITVIMSRNSDEYLDSIHRTTRVKRGQADYCISNHINAGGGEGAETIYSIHSDGKLAEGILKALVADGAKYRRFFKKAGSNGDYYYMHRMTGKVEVIIVEYGFADNDKDTDKILKDWKKYAESVAKYYIENVFNQKYIAEVSEPVKTVVPPKPQVKSETTTYNGNSIVDYLKKNKKDSSYKARQGYAEEYGIANYKGSEQQNEALLNAMIKGKVAPKKATQPSYIGKRVESIWKDDLNFYNKPSWNKKDIVTTITKGYGFPTIVAKVKVGTAYQYKVKNSKGAIYYITASEKYVTVK